MPTYDVKCRTCDSTFEVQRAMAQADDPCTCPQGHHDTQRLVSAAAVGGSTTSKTDSDSSGGCCGGGCCG